MKNKRIVASVSLFFLVIAGFALLFASCKTSPRTVEGRTVIADLDPIETAVITAQFQNFLGTSIVPSQVSISFAPRTDEALLQFRMHGNTYMLYLHREARQLVRESAVLYNEDFEATRLERGMSQRKAESIYGSAKDCYMEWGLGSLAMNGEGSPRIATGYRFENGSPYFVITVYSADNPKYKSSLSNIEKSIKYAIYMNKAQALALADALDEAALMKALDTVSIPIVTSDEYRTGGDSGADAYGGNDNGR